MLVWEDEEAREPVMAFKQFVSLEYQQSSNRCFDEIIDFHYSLDPRRCDLPDAFGLKTKRPLSTVPRSCRITE